MKYDTTSLRRNVRHLREEVWSARQDVDAYTGLVRKNTATENVDHVLEVQLVEHVVLGTLSSSKELTERMREVVNSTKNLNVTSQKINQSKKGPFTAAINRLNKRDGTLREISVEQLARSGRAKWLVDDGSWARIETEVVRCYESMQIEMQQKRLTRAQRKIMDEVQDELHMTLSKIKIF